MPLKFRSFKNKKTGQVCPIPAGRYGNLLNQVKRLLIRSKGRAKAKCYVAFARPALALIV